MGGGFDLKTRKYDCMGQGVTKELDKVFADLKKVTSGLQKNKKSVNTKLDLKQP